MCHKVLNLIDGCISSYLYIINSPKRLHMINQANKLESVLGDIESDRLGEKYDRENIAIDVDVQRNNKSEQKQMR